jgi:hypothetical protein
MRRSILAALGAAMMFIAVSEAMAAKDGIEWGANMRLRQEYWRDVFDLNKDVPYDDNFFRTKTTVWGRYDIDENKNVYVRLANEWRRYLKSNTATWRSQPVDGDEGIIDNVYVEGKKLVGGKLDVKLGRQDFLGVFGEGFLIMDGTPGDGSRTFYFDAIKATWRFNEKNSVDVAFIKDTAVDGMLLFENGFGPKKINTSDEEAGVVYGHMKPADKVTVEPYFMAKREKTAPKLDLYTVGGRAVYVAGPWKARGELAMQSGKYDVTPEKKRSGTGGYAFLTRSFKEAMFSPEVEAGMVYLSGDDTTTTDVEGWDPLFSRWPWMSELYILTYASETKIPAYWTNLSMIMLPQVKLQLAKNTSFTGSYKLLRAPQKTAVRKAMFSNSGTNRGQLLGVTVRQTINKNVSAYIMVEHLVAGDFYENSVAPGPADFIRWNVDIKFK